MLDDVESPVDAPETTPARARRRLRPAHEVRDRRRRLVTWGLVFCSFVFLVNALFGERGYLAAVQARQEYRTLSDEVNRLEEENQRYLEAIRGLQTDPAALEDAVRREVGLVRPGETLVFVHTTRPANSPSVSK